MKQGATPAMQEAFGRAHEKSYLSLSLRSQAPSTHYSLLSAHKSLLGQDYYCAESWRNAIRIGSVVVVRCPRSVDIAEVRGVANIRRGQPPIAGGTVCNLYKFLVSF